MTLDFALVGQPKSGTTALASFLAEHPSLCLSVPKETAHFATDLARESDAFHGRSRYFEYRDAAAYERCFDHCEPGMLRGDASTAYLHSAEAARNIHRANPQARIIALLRDPVDLMHSLHMQYVNETTEDEPSFERALELEAARRSGQRLPPRVRCPSFLQYRDRARYAPQLARYLDCFGAERVLVLTTEEFRRDNEGHYRVVLDHLGVDHALVPQFREVHGSVAPRSRTLNRVLNAPGPKGLALRVLGPQRYTAVRGAVARLVMEPSRRPALPQALVEALRDELADDVEATSRLVGRDLRAVWGW